MQALRSPDGERNILFQLEGTETLGSCLQVAVLDGCSVDLLQCSFQWHRISRDRKKTELISGEIFYFQSPPLYYCALWLGLGGDTPSYIRVGLAFMCMPCDSNHCSVSLYQQ